MNIKALATAALATVSIATTTTPAQAGSHCLYELASDEAINLVRGGMTPHEVKNYFYSKDSRWHDGTRLCDIRMRGDWNRPSIRYTYPRETAALLRVF